LPDVERAFPEVRSTVSSVMIRARNRGERDGFEVHARRGEARVLRALIGRFPGHLGLVVLPSGSPSLSLGGAARWRLVACRVDGRGARLSFPPDVFDVVLLLHAFGSVSDPATLLAEAVRVLAPPGRLVTVHRHPLAPGRPRPPALPLTRLLRAQGLRIESRATLCVPLFPRLLPSPRVRPFDRIVVAQRPPPASGLLLPGFFSRRRLRGSVPQGSRYQS
jgi:SAM-dependent methyltransferase